MPVPSPEIRGYPAGGCERALAAVRHEVAAANGKPCMKEMKNDEHHIIYCHIMSSLGSASSCSSAPLCLAALHCSCCSSCNSRSSSASQKVIENASKCFKMLRNKGENDSKRTLPRPRPLQARSSTARQTWNGVAPSAGASEPDWNST